MRWFKVKNGAKYADVSERTFRKWFNQGLRHARLPTGTVLVKSTWIDAWLERFADNRNEVEGLVREITNQLMQE